MKIYVLHIELLRTEESEIAGVYSSEEKAEAAGKKIEEQCKEHDIYKYEFYGWYVTEHDLDDEEQSIKEDPITVRRIFSNPDIHKDYFRIRFRSNNFTELLRIMRENKKTITDFWYDFDICTMQNNFVLEFGEQFNKEETTNVHRAD